MLIFGEDDEGRFGLSTHDCLIIREIFKDTYIGKIVVRSTRGGNEDYCYFQSTNQQDVRDRWFELMIVWKAEHTARGEAIFKPPVPEE